MTSPNLQASPNHAGNDLNSNSQTIATAQSVFGHLSQNIPPEKKFEEKSWWIF